MAMDVSVGKSGKKGRSTPEMNVTPLVDVVLVLLIIFTVITPMLAQKFWVHVPERPDPNRPVPEQPADDEQGPVVVWVDAWSRIRINRDVVADAELETRIHRILAARGNRQIFFDAHDDAPVGRAMEVLDRARAGGATTIAVVTEALPQRD